MNPEQKLQPTPAQTVGPFYGYALPFDRDNQLLAPGLPGTIRLHGTVYDGAGEPIPDVLLEIWQADSAGNISREAGPLVRDGYTFTGWGRTAVDGAGNYTFTTVNPGAVEEGAAPFISLLILGRGLTHKLHTRIYLPEDEEALAGDQLLSSLPRERRNSLIAARETDGGLRFDVYLQGENETVFLSFPGA